MFADCFYKAATESPEVRRGHGILLNQYLMSHDIDEWSTAFLDPSWTHEVIRLTEVCITETRIRLEHTNIFIDLFSCRKS